MIFVIAKELPNNQVYLIEFDDNIKAQEYINNNEGYYWAHVKQGTASPTPPNWIGLEKSLQNASFFSRILALPTVNAFSILLKMLTEKDGNLSLLAAILPMLCEAYDLTNTEKAELKSAFQNNYFPDFVWQSL